MQDLPAILVVEDDLLLQTFIEEALGDGGFEPAIAASGEEAVTLLKGHKGKYRALVTDINLRRQDGWLGGRPTCPGNRPRLSRRLYERDRRCGLGFERRSEKHYAVQAICLCPTSHRYL